MTDLILSEMDVPNQPHADLDDVDRAIIQRKVDKIRARWREGQRRKGITLESTVYSESGRAARLVENFYH